MKKAVMYGAGNIGRGFIAQLFSLSGYQTVFVDVNEELVSCLSIEGSYPLFITNGDKYDMTLVENVCAVSGRDIPSVAAEIAEADIMATAVGVNILKFIAKPLAAGISLRSKINAPELNIIVCENKIDANEYLKSLIAERLDGEALEYLNTKVGFVEASIGRMVPAPPAELKADFPLCVCVEPFCSLPVDKDAFKGEIPEIKNMEPHSGFELYIQRKLFMHNMSHATVAYVGNLLGYTYIWDAAGDERIRGIAKGALSESAAALSAEHGADLNELTAFGDELLERYKNKLLSDTVRRVGADTVRKLSPADRLVGAMNLCEKHGIKSSHIKAAIAAALHFSAEGDDFSKQIYDCAQNEGAKTALERFSGITDPSVLDEIAKFYELFARGKLKEILEILK